MIEVVYEQYYLSQYGIPSTESIPLATQTFVLTLTDGPFEIVHVLN